MSDPCEPTLWEVMAVDPAIPIDPATLRLIILDQRRSSRLLIYPWARILSRLAVTAIAVAKRVVPVPFTAHATIPFALCLTAEEYRRAVHSMRLDTSLLGALAALTGDAAFLRWQPVSFPLRVDSNADVPQMVYEHAVRCEYAHARLCQLRDAASAGMEAATGGRPAGVPMPRRRAGKS